MTDVVWITPSWPWAEAPVGGIFFQTQATALARRGGASTVICPTPLAPWPLSESMRDGARTRTRRIEP